MQEDYKPSDVNSAASSKEDIKKFNTAQPLERLEATLLLSLRPSATTTTTMIKTTTEKPINSESFQKCPKFPPIKAAQKDRELKLKEKDFLKINVS